MNLKIRVTNKQGKGVGVATVKIILDDDIEVSKPETDDRGYLDFADKTSCAGRRLTLEVAKEGFKTHRQVEHPTADDCSATIELEREAPPSEMTCAITGSLSVQSGRKGIVYNSNAPPGATHQWSIMGNGTIDGDITGSSVKVVAGVSGSFELTDKITCDGQLATPSLTVHINKKIPSIPILIGAMLLVIVAAVAWKILRPTPPPHKFVAEPKVLLFEANPNQIKAGASSTLSWSVQDATNLEISSLGALKSLSGTRNVKPTGNTTYTLTAKNDGGTTVTSLTVNVTRSGGAKPNIVKFEAKPIKNKRGTRVTLSWNVKDAKTIEISSVEFVGNKRLKSKIIYTRKIRAGRVPNTIQVILTRKTTYTLKATNEAGTRAKSVTVNTTNSGLPQIAFPFTNPVILPHPVVIPRGRH